MVNSLNTQIWFSHTLSVHSDSIANRAFFAYDSIPENNPIGESRNSPHSFAYSCKDPAFLHLSYRITIDKSRVCTNERLKYACKILRIAAFFSTMWLRSQLSQSTVPAQKALNTAVQASNWFSGKIDSVSSGRHSIKKINGHWAKSSFFPSVVKNGLQRKSKRWKLPSLRTTLGSGPLSLRLRESVVSAR